MRIHLVWLLFCVNVFATEINHGIVDFDVSHPVDASGFTLQGHNLTGGSITFKDHLTSITPLLQLEEGAFNNPIVTSKNNKPLIKTSIQYKAIKLINPNGIDNLFIKIGMAKRTETVNGLDPFVVKKSGTYSWTVPIFAFGKEHNTVNGVSANMQVMEVGEGGAHFAKHNGIYTMEYLLYTQGSGDAPIAGHPQKTDETHLFLQTPYKTAFDCHASGIWGSTSDPYRTVEGRCHGVVNTFQAGPNLDYEVGTYELPTVKTPWDATPKDTCFIKGKRHHGCTQASIGTRLNFSAQKIKVPLESNVTLTAAFGSVYHQLNVHNLRYECKSNTYLKLPASDCHAKSYLSGGWSAPYFSVGFEYAANDGNVYVMNYVYTPMKENSNRLAWRDSSTTKVLYTTVIQKGKNKPTLASEKKYVEEAVAIIKKYPALDEILLENFLHPRVDGGTV